MFEVQDLKYATLATVSRCGMVSFSEAVAAPEMVIENYLKRLRAIPFQDFDDDFKVTPTATAEGEEQISPVMQVIDLLVHFARAITFFLPFVCKTVHLILTRNGNSWPDYHRC